MGSSPTECTACSRRGDSADPGGADVPEGRPVPGQEWTGVEGARNAIELGERTRRAHGRAVGGHPWATRRGSGAGQAWRADGSDAVLHHGHGVHGYGHGGTLCVGAPRRRCRWGQRPLAGVPAVRRLHHVRHADRSATGRWRSDRTRGCGRASGTRDRRGGKRPGGSCSPECRAAVRFVRNRRGSHRRRLSLSSGHRARVAGRHLLHRPATRIGGRWAYGGTHGHCRCCAPVERGTQLRADLRAIRRSGARRGRLWLGDRRRDVVRVGRDPGSVESAVLPGDRPLAPGRHGGSARRPRLPARWVAS